MEIIEEERNEAFASTDFESSSLTVENELSEEHGQDESPPPVIAQEATRAVRHLKVCVVSILFTATVFVTIFAYVYARNDEVSDFENTYADYVQKVIETVNMNAQNKLEAIGALANEVQAYAINSNQSWPFITMPFFEERVMSAQTLLDAYALSLFPIVYDADRAEWEAYSVKNRQWINASYAAQRYKYGSDGLENALDNLTGDVNWFDILWGPDYLEDDSPDFSLGISTTIFKTRHADDPENHNPSVDDTAGPYFPQWQTAPMGLYYQSTVNCNYAHYADFLEQTQVVRDQEHAAFGQAWTDYAAPGYLSTLLYPIFDSFYGEQRTIVAFLSMDIFWKAFLEDILPSSNDGIYVVIENTCNQSFTYELFGKSVTFMGEGDLHETEFDDLQRSTVFGKPLMEPITSETYVGVPLDGSLCPYTFYIYPSKDMHRNYVSIRPVILSISAFSIFLFTSIVFILYDVLVERRQRLVLHSATRADKLVSSLFPAAVKDRLYDGQKEASVHQKDKDTFKNTNEKTETEEVSAIAELYPETTVMFGDIAGFTAWSAKRQPSEVFLLLETIYGSFDRIAKKLGVFKVETIGDCYMAVTGIPKPQQNHALIMTKFARACHFALRDDLLELTEKLGMDTVDLAMRIGIHSGPVTAGVLRGEKARFQLFGDTVNTASRMESNGAPHRIHVSESTADLLRKAGKSHWLKLREDPIIAKGKGEMTTYWIGCNDGKMSKYSGHSTRSELSDSESFYQQSFHESTENFDNSISDLDMLSKRLHQRMGSARLLHVEKDF